MSEWEGMPPTAWPLTDQARTNIEAIVDQLKAIDDLIGTWTYKCEARQTGASIHAKFENKIGVNETLRWIELIFESPALLADACRRLLAADDAAKEHTA